MSKHDYSARKDYPAKKDYSAKKTEDRRSDRSDQSDQSDQLLSSDVFAPERSGLGKEIKISLAVVTLLLGGLGYALYGHFFGANGKDGDTSVAAAGQEDKTPSTNTDDTKPVSTSVTTAQPTIGGTTATVTTKSRWGTTAGQEQPSTSQSSAAGASSSFSYMPSDDGRASATRSRTSQTAANRNAAYQGGRMVETSVDTGSSDATTDTSSYSGQTYDPFQRRTAQDRVGSRVSQRQTGGYSPQTQTSGQGLSTYGRSTGSQTYSDWQSDSRSSTSATVPSIAIVSPDTDTAASAQVTAAPSQASQRGNLPSYAAKGSKVRIQSTPQNSTDSHGYATSTTHGYTGGTASPKPESSSSSQGRSSYNVSAQPSVPRASTDYSAVSTAPDSSQYDILDDDSSDGKYTVQPLDNYSKISKKLYQTDSYFRALAQHNRAAFPDANRLDVGKEIETPSVSELERLYPDLCPTPEHRDAAKHRRAAVGTVSRSAGTTVYVVQEGDTLFDIARYELGKAARWAEIYKLNRARLGKSFDYLTPGLELVMPSGSTPSDKPAGTMTRRSGSPR